MQNATLTAHHFVLIYLVQQQRTVPRWTFHGVDYRIRIPAEREFPARLPTLDLFTRFVVRTEGTAEFRLRERWDVTQARSDQLIE
jgi:hypothetical protein